MSSGPLLFNPGRVDPDALEAVSVGREVFARQLEQDLLADAASGTSRHWLLIGARGVGKSHLTQLIAHRLQRDHGWSTLRLPEEHHRVAGVADLLEQIVTHTAGGASPFALGADPKRVEELAVDLLRRRREAEGRPTLVILENLGTLLGQLDRRDQSRLREVLMHDSPIVLLSTSPGPVGATLQESEPFYDFFQTRAVEELSRGDAHRLVAARMGADPALDASDTRWQLDAAYHLTGGNPRLILTFLAVLRRGPAPLHEQILQLLDAVTPQYQARLAEISPQMARVLTEMALAEGPLTPAEIGRRTRLKTNQVTANLAKLEAARLVRPGGRPDNRSRYSEVADRLLRVWLNMREGRGGRLRALSAFYAAHYSGASAEERARAWAQVGVADAPPATLHPEIREALALVSSPPATP